MRITTKIVCLSLCLLLATSTALHAQEKSSQATEKSCRRFAQGFYDWYIRKLNAGGYYMTALKYKRSAFSPELFRLIKGARAYLAKTGDAILDFDPFLGGSDWPDHYVIGRARIKGDRCWADSGANNAELMFKDTRWVFVNFHYGKGKDDDLLRLLREQLRGERRKNSK